MATDTAHADAFSVGAVEASLARYAGFGVKQAGGPGDEACGAWLEEVVQATGYATVRQTFEAPYFTPSDCTLIVGDTRTPLLAQAPVTTTAGLTAPLVISAPGETRSLQGAIVVAPLSFRRWSTALAPEVTNIIARAAREGALAVLLVTHGLTGEAVALNVEAHRTWLLPVAVLAPKDAEPVLAAAVRGANATVTLRGQGGVRSAWNLVATLDRGKGRRVVVSTPRSGWTVCAGERGGGVATWLALATWAPRALRNHDLTFVCTSAHEYEYLGGERFLQSALAPKPDDTHLWAHLGANVAARDWHEFGPGRLAPLPGVDPQRVLMGATDMLPVLRETFRGAPGLEAPYAANEGVAGELASILHAGQTRAFGIFGAHRYHHTAVDDARCLVPGHTAATAVMVREAIRRLAA